MRALIIHALDIQDMDPEKMPTKEELGNLILQATMAAEQAKAAADAAAKAPQLAPGAPAVPGAKAPKVPGVKKAASTTPSYGDNSYRKDASTAARTGAKG
jgi:hypothetical protein